MKLKADNFPRLPKSVRAKWAPILLSPIMGSPERLVIAVIAATEQDFHIEAANALRKLECLFGDDAETPSFVADVAIQELRAALSEGRTNELQSLKMPFSSVSLGEVYEGEAESLQHLAQSWMGTLSSLYYVGAESNLYKDSAVLYEAEGVGSNDRLPSLVFDYVLQHRPGLKTFFNSAIRENRKRRVKAHGVDIDYSGSNIVANFSTLVNATRAQSVDRIKRKIFDLIVDRDSELQTISHRPHEMFVYHPHKDDPTITERQYENLVEALEGLSAQSRKEEIGFVSVSAVPEIGKRIVEAEARPSLN